MVLVGIFDAIDVIPDYGMIETQIRDEHVRPEFVSYRPDGYSIGSHNLF
ncbi:MAG: hypothetical protein KAW93_06360 [Methanogenium sp.]|nr:hypothetical protein [Methanogenium sp.]